MRKFFNAVLLSFVAIASLVATSVLTAERVQQRPIRLHYDGGGEISAHVKFFKYIAEARVPVEIDGDCVSACTLVLSLPAGQACIYPDARLGFHQATDFIGKPEPKVTQSLINRFYPPAVQRWIKDHGPLVSEPIYLIGTEAIELGILPSCLEKLRWP
jgi:hypothetical protein